jgi:hypothetical protein
MNRRQGYWIILAAGVILATGLMVSNVPQLAGQKIETVNGIRVVHNQARGVWGKKPAVKLEPVLKLGDIDSPDEHTAFYLPAAVAVDRANNIYVLDSGNNRIQKFSADGKFLTSFGRFGQGPGEFIYPGWLAIDGSGNLYVSDPHNRRLQILGPDGKDLRSIRFTDLEMGNIFVATNGNLLMQEPAITFSFARDEKEKTGKLPGLIKVIDQTGKVIQEIGERLDMKNELLTNTINNAVMTLDAHDNIYLVFPFQNRIEKYSAEGKLIWRADRELPYSLEVQDEGSIERRGSSLSIRQPKINRSSLSVAVDGQGRVWVLTLARQLKKEEQVAMGVSMSRSASGGDTIGYKVQGDTDLRETDALKLEVFDGEGVLLGEIPLDIFVDHIFIYGDRLFLLDKLRGASVHIFRIKG